MSTTPQRMLDQIQKVKAKKLKRLSLYGEKFNKIPEEIFQLDHLEELILRNYAIIKIPDQIKKLKKLKSLDLRSNQLRSLPESVTHLQQLTTLDLRSNQLSSLPESITRLQQLTMLDLGKNKFSSLPEPITCLKKLTTLNLSSNQLSSLPESITRLKKLTVLDLRSNQLSSLPESITRLKQLTALDLSSNQLSSLPKSITRINKLTTIDLSYNKLSSLPKPITRLQQLTTLVLSYNKLSSLPESTTRLQQLTTLRVEGNPLEKPPLEVALKGMDAIKDYFRQLKEGVDYLYEAKMLIIGEGGAGKTTLTKKLEDADYVLPKNEASTEGIEVIKWEFPLKKGRLFRVNIWDFGGQEIYHATHQFFLTKRSLYALVADTRKEDTDFYYWLNVVELLADDSPLLIIKNEKQDRKREINEKQLRGEFDNLKETLATNLATTRGLPELLKAIQYHLGTLPHVGSPLPKTWVKVRETLEEDTRYTIALYEYLAICEQHGFTRHEDKLQLSGYLHDLGVCLHFQDDPVLKNIVIIKPDWATNAVYGVLDDQTVIRNQGKFCKADLDSIWYETKYATMHDELLQLMLKFKLCYRIKHRKWYIAPQLLTLNQPEYEWDEHDNLLLRYQYTFMPKGIMTRFIVAMHHLIAQQRYVWRSGVMLQDEQTKAEVIEHYGKREINVRVVGRQKKELMTIIDHELEQIHRSFKRLKYQKLIPCNCENCSGTQAPHFYEFDKLLERKAHGKYEIECGKPPYKMVNVLSLIDDIRIKTPVEHRQQETDRNHQTIHVHTKQFLLQEFNDSDVVQDITTDRKDDDMAKRKKKKKPIKSAWANGSFYLFAFVVVIGGLGVLANSIPFSTLAVVLIAGLLFIPVIGAFQLRQDDNLTEKSFIQLMRMVIGQLPLIGKAIPQPEQKEEEQEEQEEKKKAATEQ